MAEPPSSPPDWRHAREWSFIKQQGFADVLQNWCFSKYGKIHRKAPVLDSFFNKVADPLATASDIF